MAEAIDVFSRAAERAGRPIVDYVLSPQFPHSHGVFIVARHDDDLRDTFRYLKLGDGPYYAIVRHHLFMHLELCRTIRSFARTRRVLLDNSRNPELSIAAIAKRDLRAGAAIDNGYGSFDLRGQTIRRADAPEHAPIGLVRNAVVRRDLRAGDTVMLDDLELPDTEALRLWRSLPPQGGLR
jgi:predicted homoserine dehydrogenase-like protein